MLADAAAQVVSLNCTGNKCIQILLGQWNKTQNYSAVGILHNL